VIPLSVGGDHGPGNIVVCCKTCNFRKNKRIPPDAILQALSDQLGVFVELLPPEAEYAAKGAIPMVIREALWRAEPMIRGKGVPVGTSWMVSAPAAGRVIETNGGRDGTL
jgi:hypothetical protein